MTSWTRAHVVDRLVTKDDIVTLLTERLLTRNVQRPGLLTDSHGSIAECRWSRSR